MPNQPDPGDRVRLRETDQGDAAPELLIDGSPVRYGQFPDGTFFLYENAYVWSDDLIALGHQLIADRASGRVPLPADESEGGE